MPRSLVGGGVLPPQAGMHWKEGRCPLQGTQPSLFLTATASFNGPCNHPTTAFPTPTNKIGP